MNGTTAAETQFAEMRRQLDNGDIHDSDYLALPTLFERKRLHAVDVGANRGQSIIALKLLFPDIVIEAFEANPLFDQCLRYLAQRFDPSVRVHPFGLGRTDARVLLFVPWVGDEPYFEEASTRRDYFDKPWVAEKFCARGMLRLEEAAVDIRPGDALGLTPDIVKIDVEGAEHDVLLGLRETIVRSRPILLVENSDWDHVTPLLAELEYDPFRWDPESVRLVAYSGTSTNTFYLHRSRQREACAITST